MKYKEHLKDLVAGDTVVYVVRGYGAGISEAYECIVKRVTKTRVMVNRPRDNNEVSLQRETGLEIGARGSFRDMIKVGPEAEKYLKIGHKNMSVTEIKHLLFQAEREAKAMKPDLQEVLENVEKVAALIRKLDE